MRKMVRARQNASANLRDPPHALLRIVLWGIYERRHRIGPELFGGNRNEKRIDQTGGRQQQPSQDAHTFPYAGVYVIAAG